MILGQNFNFLLTLSMVKMDLKAMFGGVLEWSQSDLGHI